MTLVDIHLIKGGIITGGKKTETGKSSAEPVAVEGHCLRDLTWLTAADVKILVIG